MKFLRIDLYIFTAEVDKEVKCCLLLSHLGFTNIWNISAGFMGISFYEFFNDKAMNRKPILTNYNFDLIYLKREKKHNYEKRTKFIRSSYTVINYIIGHNYLKSSMLFLRLVLGMTLGYALTRSFMGFAGSVNRAYNTGSTKLMRVLMGMFTATAAISIAFLYNADPGLYDLWVNPINLGLILGGILFGFGMTFSMCCASGVLQI